MKYIKVTAILAVFLVAGLAAGYIFNNTGNESLVSFSDGGFSELFVNTDSEIIIYTLPDCPFCHQLKDFLNTNEIVFDERNVLESERNYEEATDLGGNRVPILVTKHFKIEGFIEKEVSNILVDRGYMKDPEQSD